MAEGASCAWGCRNSDHAEENVVRRLANSSLVALRLSLLGLADDALASVRSACEIANLIQLFLINPSRLADWKVADERTLLREFPPSAVRGAIEAAGEAPFVGKTEYGMLSSHSVHVSARSAGASTHLDGRTYVGAAPPDVAISGLVMAANELAHVLWMAAPAAAALVRAPEDKLTEIVRTSEELAGTVVRDRFWDFGAIADQRGPDSKISNRG